MFYCDPCGQQRGWPLHTTHFVLTSYGKCECCGFGAVCNDVPSKNLPAPDPPGTAEAIESIKRAAEEAP